ncbi:hypothetical protein GF373_10480 [bacterium]|nr:hypothetical protein [bacterium]
MNNLIENTIRNKISLPDNMEILFQVSRFPRRYAQWILGEKREFSLLYNYLGKAESAG